MTSIEYLQQMFYILIRHLIYKQNTYLIFAEKVFLLSTSNVSRCQCHQILEILALKVMTSYMQHLKTRMPTNYEQTKSLDKLKATLLQNPWHQHMLIAMSPFSQTLVYLSVFLGLCDCSFSMFTNYHKMTSAASHGYCKAVVHIKQKHRFNVLWHYTYPIYRLYLFLSTCLRKFVSSQTSGNINWS